MKKKTHKTNYVQRNKGLYVYNINENINKIELLVLSCIINTCARNKKLKNMNFTDRCFLTNKQIADILCIDRKVVGSAINSLIKKDLILIDDGYNPNYLLSNNKQRSITVSEYIDISQNNNDWIIIPNNILKSKTLSIAEKLVFGYLYSWGNLEKECISRTQVIQDFCKIKSDKTIRSVINKFQDKGVFKSELINGNKRVITMDKEKATYYIENVDLIECIQNVDNIQTVEEVSKIENVNNIQTVGDIDKIQNVNSIHITSYALDSVDLSNCTKDELMKGYKAMKNILELYKIAINSRDI